MFISKIHIGKVRHLQGIDINLSVSERKNFILLELCEDANVAKRVSSMAQASLSVVDASVVADEVFESLNSIQVEDLWDNSGKTRWGYHDPTEVAFEMVEEEVDCFVQKMEQYQSLGMKTEEKAYYKGIILGMLKYEQDRSNEFRDWCPDDPFTIAENIIDDWKKEHTDDETAEIQAEYDNFFSDGETD